MKLRLKWMGMLAFLLAAAPLKAGEIWVSPSGDDRNPGTQSSPKATLQAALRQAREWRRLNDPAVQGGIHVWLLGGTYSFHDTQLFTPEDSGTPDSPTTVEGAPGQEVVFSGGVPVTGWKLAAGCIPGWSRDAGIYVADAPRFNGRRFSFRQLWVNDRKACLSAQTDTSNLLRISGVDSKNRAIRIPFAKGLVLSKPQELELFLHQMWEVAVLRVASLEAKPKTGEAVLKFREPEARLEFEHPWPPPVISAKGNSPFILRNALEFLDQPGEWYHDRAAGKIYYLPRKGEFMDEARVMVPALETLMDVQGTPERPVHDLHFRNITFAHTTWMRPSQQGYVPLQAGMFLLDAYKLQVPGTPDKASLENQAWVGRQSAAVRLLHVRQTSFEDCRFQHLGATGLDYWYGTGGDRVEGCYFADIAGSALLLGKFSDPGIEAHLPYDPTDARELTRDLTIANNLVEDVANEYWGCCGMTAGFVRDVRFLHNELRHLPYSGISVGWGWTRTLNCMRNNTIQGNLVYDFGRHHYSCGGVYTLSAQPGTRILDNAIHSIRPLAYAHDTTDYRIYLDEASSYIEVRNNWTDKPKFGFNQPGMLVFENNGPQVADSIRNNAGLEKTYRSRLYQRSAQRP